MSIWFANYTLDDLARLGRDNMGDYLGIVFTAIDDDSLTATMPVDHRTVQPAGLLHGGASAALAETVGSIAANLTVDPAGQSCVGLEINANHLRGVRSGLVVGTARPLHLGKGTQVWEIRIADEEGHLVCVSRLTMAVLERPAGGLLGTLANRE